MGLASISKGGDKMQKLKAIVGGLILVTAGYAFAAENMPAGVQARKTDSGTVVLADAKGMTLYTYGKDSDGKSACVARCAMAWPPLAASADAKAMGDWTVITRDDGTKQWAYKGMPLYTFARDAKAGDATGDGMGGNWHIAKP